ncbi:MAG: formylmethanofuran dehydrogenase [Candidatus Rokubacteria bacterium]|nr:formylmethanofuran dehydrogenase [Candidatus Rokubacteria bacterium]
MRPLDELLQEAVTFHGHLCPGQVLGVRMAIAGCRELAVVEPKSMQKNLVVFVEIDRCATDAIQAVTGCSLGRRTLKHVDYGKMAATFVNLVTGEALRVVARDDARELAAAYAPGVVGPREAQIAAYRVMPEAQLLRFEPVVVLPGWLDRRRVRVPCQLCGEGVNYGREVPSNGLTVCRACFAGAYYLPRAPAARAAPTTAGTQRSPGRGDGRTASIRQDEDRRRAIPGAEASRTP